MNINKTIKNSGFTLVELMVATALFSVIVIMGIGSLTTASNTAREARKLRNAVDNLNFAMESMTRELRTGSNYSCGPSMGTLDSYGDSGSQPCDILVFTSQEIEGKGQERIGYFIDRREGGTNGLKRCIDQAGPENCSFIVSEHVNLDVIKFYISGSTPSVYDGSYNSGTQPSVKIVLRGRIEINGKITPFSIQTLASQRSSEFSYGN